MDLDEKFKNFQDEYNAYGKLIKEYSIAGEKAINNIKNKQDYFNSLTDNQRIEYMNSDPDFILLQNVLKNLRLYYASFFDFVNKSANEIPDLPSANN
jgi:hypothetical protein